MSEWNVPTTDRQSASELANQLSMTGLLARILVARGVSSVETARAFLQPKLAHLSNPDNMADRAVAADRIARAIEHGESIVIFGDYDVDGTTSAALLTHALRAMGASVSTQIASRFGGGYGFSNTALQQVLEAHPKLVITCDCGTSDHERLAVLRGRGIDAIVVDHHRVPDEPLGVTAFLNPHRADCGFKYKHLASVGLALSLAAAVRAKRNAHLDLRQYLDLVAVGTIADVAPLDGDNRILVRSGLERMARGEAGVGLRALLQQTNVRGSMRAFDIAFHLAPLLNAPGRLGSATPTLDLLLCTEAQHATQLAQTLVKANEQRRAISQTLVDKAMEQVHSRHAREVPAGLVVAGEGWHPGVGGIVAGRLVERFQRPVIMIAIENGLGVGSARAPKGFPLFEAVQACAKMLEQFGGHDAAAGLKVRADRVEMLRDHFAIACAQIAQRTKAMITPSSSVDAELLETDLEPRLAMQLQALEPIGAGQPEPIVLARGVQLGDVREVGVGHLRARMRLGRHEMGVFIRDGVGRRARGELRLDARDNDVLGTIAPDPFHGAEAVQMHLMATRPPQ